MDEILKKRCDLQVENTRIMKKNFIREYSLMKYLCANIYTNANKEIVPDKIKECVELLKKREDLTKDFRGIGRIVIATILSLDNNPNKKLDEVVVIYKKLLAKFDNSKYLPLVAFLLSDMQKHTDYEKVTKDAKALYNDMKTKHPTITSNEDSGFCALLSLSGISPDFAIEEMEKLYELLSGNLRGDNAIQSISHILTLGKNSTDAKYCKTMYIFDELKRKKCNFTNGMEQVMVAFLVLLKEEQSVLVKKVSKVYEYLRECKGYSSVFRITKSQRLMYSCSIVADVYLDKAKKEGNITDALDITNDIDGEVILRQIMTACTMAACLEAGSSSDYE